MKVRLAVAGVIVAVVAIVVGVVVVTGGDDGPSTDDRAAAPTVELTPSASLVSSGPADGTLAPVRQPAEITVGDAVATDASGRAQIVYDDGSVSRLDHDTTVTVVSLKDPDKGTRLGLEVGQVWERVSKLTGSDKKEVETPVAVASVRGTAYAIRCTEQPVCTFTVAEGTVVVTPNAGPAVILNANERVVLGDDGAGPVEPLTIADLSDPWLGENLAADAAAGLGTTTNTSTTSPTSTPTSTTPGTAATPTTGTPTTATPTTARTASLADADPNGTWSVTTTVTAAQGVFGVSVGDAGDFTYRLARQCNGGQCTLGVTILETGTQLSLTRDGGAYVGTTDLATDCQAGGDGEVLVAGGIANSIRVTITPTQANGTKLTRFGGSIRIDGQPDQASQNAGCTASSQTNSLAGARQ